MTDFHIAIIGAGVIGLSISYYLSEISDSIVVIEKNNGIGLETSSRNSEVIHSGIYYNENSLKAKFCVEGRKLLYDFCDKYQVPYKKRGKLIVATDFEEEKILFELLKRGENNGVEGLCFMSKRELSEIEPNVCGLSAIYSKETGVFDSHFFMKKLYQISKKNNVLFGFCKEVINIQKEKDHYKIYCKDRDCITAKVVINSSGLNSDRIAQIVGIDIDYYNYRLKYYKGDYFYYSKKPVVDKLIYPIPQKGLKGLGIHITIDMGERMKFGPDAYIVSEINYDVDLNKRDLFYEKSSKLIKGLNKEFFFPDTSGIRPKLSGDEFRDFIITEESDKGFENLINLIGIESPGLTSSLAIGKYVKKIFLERCV